MVRLYRSFLTRRHAGALADDRDHASACSSLSILLHAADPAAVLPGLRPAGAAGRSHPAAERLDLRQRDAGRAVRRAAGGDPDVERWSTYVGRGAIRFYLPLNVQLANDFFAQAVIVAKDVAARERLQAKLEKVLAEEFPNVGRPRLSAGARPAGRLAGAVPRQRAGSRRGALDRARARPGRGRQPGHAADQLRLDRAAREVRIRVDQDQARLLGLSSEALGGVLNTVVSGTPVTQVRDDIYLVHPQRRSCAKGSGVASDRDAPTHLRSRAERRGARPARGQPAQQERVHRAPGPDRAGERGRASRRGRSRPACAAPARPCATPSAPSTPTARRR